MATVEVRQTDLEAGALANLLGIEGNYKRGGFRPTGTMEAGETGRYGEALITPERYGEMIEYITRDPFETELGGVAEQVLSPESLMDLWGNYQAGAEDLSRTMSEGLETGFKTDIGSIERLRRRQFERELIPQLAEQFSGTSGLSSSDFGQAVANAAADLSFELGALDFDASEAAAARRAQIAALAPQVQQAQLAMPTAFGSDLIALGEQTSPGAKLTETFMELAGVDTGGQAVVRQQGSGAAGTMTAVGTLLAP